MIIQVRVQYQKCSLWETVAGTAVLVPWYFSWWSVVCSAPPADPIQSYVSWGSMEMIVSITDRKKHNLYNLISYLRRKKCLRQRTPNWRSWKIVRNSRNCIWKTLLLFFVDFRRKKLLWKKTQQIKGNSTGLVEKKWILPVKNPMLLEWEKVRAWWHPFPLS